MVKFARFTFLAAFALLLVSCEKDEAVNHPPSTPGSPRPANGIAGVSHTPLLQWSCSDPDGDALVYHLYFGTSYPLALKQASIADTFYQITESLPNSQTSRWRIVAEDSHGDTTSGPTWQFTILPNQPPAIPSSPVPADSAVDQPRTVLAKWSSFDPEGDEVEYVVQLFLNGRWRPVQSDTILTDTLCTIRNLTPATDYTWRVVATDSNGNYVNGPSWHFSVAPNRPPTTPSAPFPAQYDAHPMIHVPFSWHSEDPEDDPVSFDFYLGTDENNLELAGEDLDTTFYMAISLEKGTEYFWKVVAEDSYGATATSVVWSFSTPHDLHLIPLHLGNWWLYETTTEPTLYETNARSIVDSDTFYNIYGDLAPTYFLINREDGVHDVLETEGEQLLWKYPVTAGDSWTYYDSGYEFQIACEDTDVTLTTEAGIFYHCIRYTFSYEGQTAYHWLQPGTGFVKRRLNNGFSSFLAGFHLEPVDVEGTTASSPRFPDGQQIGVVARGLFRME